MIIVMCTVSDIVINKSQITGAVHLFSSMWPHWGFLHFLQSDLSLCAVVCTVTVKELQCIAVTSPGWTTQAGGILTPGAALGGCRWVDAGVTSHPSQPL